MPEARIERIVGRRVWDSRGRPTVEAEIFLDNGASGRAIAPAGASTGTHEAVELRDGGSVLGGFGVDRAIANVNGEIAVAHFGGGRRGCPADADDPNIRRRRPCRSAGRYPGFSYYADRRRLVR